MATKITAPQMGEGIEEITLVKWLKQEGDKVQELEPIVEVETDKVVTELPSPASGVLLKILIEEENPANVGDILGWVGAPGEDIPDAADAKPARKVEIPKEAYVTSDKPKQVKKKDSFLSPVVRNMITQHGLNLNEIIGSGKNGRITKGDVEVYLRTVNSDGNSVVPTSTQADTEPKSQKKNILPISSIRRTIAERMIVSQLTSAHVLTVMEADLSRVVAHRAHNKPLFAEDGIRLTLTAYFIAAIIEGLKANPKVNASWTKDGLLIHPEINIGMAVSLGEEGLIVPVIKNADSLSLLGIAQQVNDLARRARQKKLKTDEVRGGTFSLTNHGMSGSLFATPIITQPQVGILGTGRVQKRAVVVTDGDGNDMIAIRPMVYLSFVFDHRVLDGEGADNFLVRVVKRLEHWD